jgi:hypothetical protein
LLFIDWSAFWVLVGWVFLFSVNRLQICSASELHTYLSSPVSDFHTNLSSLFENVAGFNGASQQHSLNDTMDNARWVNIWLFTKNGFSWENLQFCCHFECASNVWG